MAEWQLCFFLFAFLRFRLLEEIPVTQVLVAAQLVAFEEGLVFAEIVDCFVDFLDSACRLEKFGHFGLEPILNGANAADAPQTCTKDQPTQVVALLADTLAASFQGRPVDAEALIEQ